MKQFLLIVGSFILLQNANAQTAYTWKGTTSSNWNTPGNWTPNGIPGTADNVKILTAPNICLLAANTSIQDITLTSGTLDLGGSTLTVGGDTAIFTTGTVQNGILTAPAVTYTVFGNGPVTMNCTVTISSAILTVRNTSFQLTTSLTKTGATNDVSNGSNTFNGPFTFTNAGAGYELLGNANPDVYNAAATFNNTGNNNLYVAYNSTGNIFNGVTSFNNSPIGNYQIFVSQNSAGTIFNNSVLFSSTNGSGVQFGGGATASSTLAAGHTIGIGPAGFSAGTLYLRQLTQTGTTAQNLTLSGTASLVFANACTFNGNVTASSPTFFLNGTTFNGTTNLTKTGSTGDFNSGGNTFNGICSITNSGSSYWVLGNNNPDTWNTDVTFTDNGSERLLPCWATAGNQFNGNIYVNTSGGAQGIEFCGGNTTATATLAANQTIQPGTTGLTAGYLILKQFTELGNAPVTLTATGTASLYMGPLSSFGGVFTATAPDVWVQGATYNSAASFTKTGGTSNHNNQNQNIFNSTCTINQQSSTGYFMLGYNSNDLFNDNITVNSTGSGGIYLGWTSGTGTPTLAAGKTILVGGSGFSAGFLSLNTFTQLGNAPMNLTFTGTNTSLTFARNSVIGGNLTTSSPDIYFNGCTFNGTVTSTKTGANGDYGAGGNTFNGICSITNSGSSYLLLGNNNPDTWNSDVTFTDNGSERLLPCWASAGNQFNGNIFVNTSGSAQGIQFCGGNATATATQAANMTIQTGSTGLTAGYLYLKQFTQLGSAPINLTATGNSVIYLGPFSNFGGAVTATAPDIWVQGATYNSAASFTKTGGGSNHNNTYQNIFNSTCTINQQSNTGYFMLGYNSNDLFNDNIILTSTGSGGINLGYGSGTGTPTLAAGKTISVGAGGFSAGFLALNTFTQLGNAPINLSFTGSNTYINFARSSVIGGNLTTNTPDIYFNGCTFNGTVNATKTGAGNDAGGGGNTFQDSVVLNNTGTGYLILGNGAVPDTWNSTAAFNSSGSSYIALAWNSAGNIFNGNITVSSTGSSTGIYFCSNAASTATLASGYAVTTGPAGFSSGTLLLRQFTQLGNAPINLSLTGANTLVQVGPSSAIGGDFTAVSPRILLNGAVYSDTVNVTKTGATGEWSSGGNTFNNTLVVNQLGSGYFGFANGAPDIYNGDVYANNNSTERIIFGNNPVGNQFNGNIILTQVGSSVGIAFGWSATTNETMAAGKSISVGAAGFTTGYLQIERFTQLGNAPVNLPLTGTSSLTFGPTSTIGGDLTSTSGSLYFNGCTFNGMVNSTKTGATSDWSTGNNIFNGVTTMTNAGSGYLLFGNGNADQFNNVSTFNNTGSNNIYVAFNSANNIFGGVTTFNNSPTSNNLISVSQNSTGTTFNDNIIVTSTNGQGVQFCTGSATAAAALSAGKTISIGAAGFSAGTLLLRQFTQLGGTPQSLTLTGTGNLTFGPASAFGGNTTTVSPALLFNGCNFSGTVTSTKNGASNDGSIGNNTFGGAFSVTNTGTGYFLMGNGNPDIWQSTAVFNNLSTAQHMYIAWSSTGNIFNGDVTFNNQPGTTGLWIYPNQAGINTQFNGNIYLVNVNGAGINFGSSTGTATLASGGTINIGAAGFNSGSLIFRNFTQAGSGTAQNITTTGTSNIQYNTNNTFAGPVTSSSPGLFFNGTTFNGVVNCTKTGTTNDQSQGNNIFNAPATFTTNGTGYLLMTNNNPDAYNSNVTFIQSSTGRIYPNYNFNSTYAGNLTLTSTAAATTLTFGAGSGTATFSGTGGQAIAITPGTPAPIFTRLVINNTGTGVTLTNTPINVSNNLVLTSGLLNTTTSNLLIMNNGSTTAPGDATSTSYVNGPMQYQKSSSGASTLNFPIGTAPDCRPFILTVNHSSGTQYNYTAQLFDAPARDLGYSMPPSIDDVSDVHYYTIARTNTAGVSQPVTGLSGNQTIQIFFGATDWASNGSTLTIVKNTYLTPTAWSDIGGTGGPAYSGGANLTGSITSTSTPSAFNSFSTFALADRIGGGNVLPIGLLYFRAQPDNTSVDLQWATSSESNNSYFTVEKSKDGTNFDSIQRVGTEAPNGNSSSTLNYTAQDPNPYTGISYYRLKQTDLDGNSKYSNIVSVNFAKQHTLSVYPNPTRGAVYITGADLSETSLMVQWFDLSGRMLLQGTVPVSGGTATLNTNFNNGVYLLKLISSDGSYTVHNVIVLK